MTQLIQLSAGICAKHDNQNATYETLGKYIDASDKTCKKIVTVSSITATRSCLDKSYTKLTESFEKLKDSSHTQYASGDVFSKLLDLYYAIDTGTANQFHKKEFRMIESTLKRTVGESAYGAAADEFLMYYMLGLLQTKRSDLKDEVKWSVGKNFYSCAIDSYEKLTKDVQRIFSDIYLMMRVTKFACIFMLADKKTRMQDPVLIERLKSSSFYKELTSTYIEEQPMCMLDLAMVRNALVMIIMAENNKTIRHAKLHMIGSKMVEVWPEMKDIQFKPNGIGETLEEDRDIQYYVKNIHPSVI